MKINFLTLTDSYKYSHVDQYPNGTTKIFSYLESRGGQFDNTVFFGLQYYLKKYFEGQVIETWMIDEVAELAAIHFGNDKVFDRSVWDYIVSNHDGHLPLRIRAVPEGSVIPNKNVLMTIENTDPKCFWLTNFVETHLLKIWYPITTASLSRACKQKINKYLLETADNNDGLLFKLHDFGCRGVSSLESAAIGGAAHLVNFLGTDTVPAIVMLRDYYDAGKCCGFSIPATEHSTITSWKRTNECAAYRNLLERFPEGLVACVSDSYDIYTACKEMWGGELKEMVMNRNGTLVIRPDSGDPVIALPRLLTILGNAFGFSLNKKGYKILDPHVRVIWGDGINLQSIEQILEAIKESGWSTDNVAFGMGGALLQQTNRDTNKFAIKCSHAIVNGEHIDVFKDPIDDHGKKSKTGRLSLYKDFETQKIFSDVMPPQSEFESPIDQCRTRKELLQTVFYNGKVLVEQSLAEIRDLAKIQ